MNKIAFSMIACFAFSLPCFAPPEPCDLGDLTGDGIVDGSDITIVLTQWGTDDKVADISGDGIVDGIDLSLVLIDWDSCSSVGTPR